MTDKTPQQRAHEAAAETKRLDNWHIGEHAAIMNSGNLVPSARRERLQALGRDYLERWIQAKAAADRDLAEWAEVYESRAANAYEPKLPEDRDARILRALELQRLATRIERNREQPGRLLAEYDRAVSTGNELIAHELEDALPPLLPDSERHAFEQRAKAERVKRMPEDARRKVEEAEAFKREAMAVGHGLAFQEKHRAAGYRPAEPQPSTVVSRYEAGGDPPKAVEVPNPLYRTPHQRAASEAFERTLGPGTVA